MDERCQVIHGLPGASCECKAECSGHLEDLDWGYGYIECPDEVERTEVKRIHFKPKPLREVQEWADAYCYRNGWKSIVLLKEGDKLTCGLNGYNRGL